MQIHLHTPLFKSIQFPLLSLLEMDQIELHWDQPDFGALHRLYFVGCSDYKQKIQFSIKTDFASFKCNHYTAHTGSHLCVHTTASVEFSGKPTFSLHQTPVHLNAECDE
ncbi:hypothetical protein EGR_05253 [Echinococcus granulosus]|uniref:Uncharacterized protein n=1 Tax=Echinococcus granulosus TaxID=6210 RepID=W6UNQ5_ECHGR|nr:hypothetical protein EGR_05253 [Echinococcus granulosus]EUB59927.1 hypothetical protein EGR_05253 [Echinococcus granulosus]